MAVHKRDEGMLWSLGAKNWLQIDTVSLFFFFFLNHYHIISAFFCKHQHEEEVPSK